MKKHKVLIKRRDRIKQHYWKNYAAVIPKTTVPIVDYPEQYNSIKRKLIVNMEPQKYFDTLQKAIVAKLEDQGHKEEAERERNLTPDAFRDSLGGMYEDDIKEKMEKLKKGEDVNTGYIETGIITDEKGKKHLTVNFDTPGGIEAARRLGIKEVPVVLLEGRPYKSTGLMRGDWEFSPTEEQKRRDEESRTSATIRHVDSEDANINVIETKRLKKGAPRGSKYESDYEDEPEDTWREVTVIDLTKAKK